MTQETPNEILCPGKTKLKIQRKQLFSCHCQASKARCMWAGHLNIDFDFMGRCLKWARLPQTCLRAKGNKSWWIVETGTLRDCFLHKGNSCCCTCSYTITEILVGKLESKNTNSIIIAHPCTHVQSLEKKNLPDWRFGRCRPIILHKPKDFAWTLAALAGIHFSASRY